MPWRIGFFLIYIVVLSADAYILESDKVGNLIKWPSEKKVFSVYLSEDLPVNRELVISSIDEAFEGLNTGVGISFIYDNEDALSDIVISQKEFEETSDGLHQAAITSLEYSDLEIKKARIFLNKDFGFSEEKSLKNYLGNVISHELGHALGLAHSPVTSSTMYPYLNPGQYNFSKDDILGLKKLFTQSDGGGVIKGSVKSYEGGGSLLGATLELYSASEGSLIASVVTDYSGSFSFNYLDLNDSYFLRINSIDYNDFFPTFLGFKRLDVCYGENNFSPTFYSSCSKTREDNPMLISFNESSEIDLGELGVRCSPVTNFNLLDSISTNSLYKINLNEEKLLEYGFSSLEISFVPTSDTFKLELDFLEVIDKVSSGLDIKIGVLDQSLGSRYAAKVSLVQELEGVEIRRTQLNLNSEALSNGMLVPVNSRGLVDFSALGSFNTLSFSGTNVYLEFSFVDLKSFLANGTEVNEAQLFSKLAPIKDTYDALVFLRLDNWTPSVSQVNTSTIECSEGITSVNIPDLRDAFSFGEASSSSGVDSSEGGLFSCSSAFAGNDNEKPKHPHMSFINGFIMSLLINYFRRKFFKNLTSR